MGHRIFPFSSMVERPAVNRVVTGSSPVAGGETQIIWAVGLQGVVACLASRKYRWVQFPHGPLRVFDCLIRKIPKEIKVTG